MSSLPLGGDQTHCRDSRSSGSSRRLDPKSEHREGLRPVRLLPGWYTDPYRQVNLRWWVLDVRWWDGNVWSSFAAYRRFGWVPTTLVAAAGLWIWLVDAVMSLDLAHGVAATPQPNQESWMLVSEW